jgi:hypothetical protein
MAKQDITILIHLIKLDNSTPMFDLAFPSTIPITKKIQSSYRSGDLWLPS